MRLWHLLCGLTWQQLGLASFVITAGGMLLVLLFDLFLALTGRTMITTYLRANPGYAWLVLAVIQFGMMGLAVHLMSPVKIDADQQYACGCPVLPSSKVQAFCPVHTKGIAGK